MTLTDVIQSWEAVLKGIAGLRPSRTYFLYPQQDIINDPILQDG